MKNDWTSLAYPLPDDIRLLKDNGKWDDALEQIDFLLAKKPPKAMQERLLLEKTILGEQRLEYTIPWEEAVCMMKEELLPSDQTPEEELFFYMRNGNALWHYNDGKICFHRRFFRTLMNTRPELVKRWKKAPQSEEDDLDWREKLILTSTIHEMQEKGYAARKIHARCILKVEDDAFRPGEKLRVHLPVPAVCQQVKSVNILNISPKPTYIAPEDHPSRTIYFEEAPTENHEYSVEFEYINRVDYVKPDPDQVSKVQPDFHTEEQAPHILFTPYIRSLVKELTEGETNPLRKARAFYDFVTTKVDYIFMPAYYILENIPEFAAKNFKGDCGVQALLFITLCRAAGIPARWQSGLCAGPLDIGMHDWAQFYIAPYGWMYADCSYGGSAYRAGNEERWNHYFGNLDPYRAIMNSEYQYEFDPPKLENRHDPYDNQIGEAEYEGHGLMGPEFDGWEELLGIETVEDDI